MRIYLVGYMGSGKTYYGKELAKCLNFCFIDTDEMIQKHTGKTIATLFKENGEKHFRKIEQKMLNTTLEMENTVIATGGGTAIFHNNMQLMNQNGLTIFLKPSFDVIYNRLYQQKDSRPLLKDINKDQVSEFISLHIKERNRFYREAKIIISPEHTNPNNVKKFLNIDHK